MAISHQPLAITGPTHSQLDPPYTEPIAAREVGAPDLLIVNERPVGAREVFDLDVPVGGGQPAVNPRDERRVDNEVGPRRATDRLDRSGGQPERSVGALKNPHAVAILATAVEFRR